MLDINELNKNEALKTLLNGYEVDRAVVNEQINNLINNGISNIKKVCVYGRVSSKKEEQESSIISQNTIFHNFLRDKENYVLAEEIYEQETGTLIAKRPKFQRMIKNALAGKYNLLIFKDTKRMCRNTEELLHITEDLKRNNVYCYFISEALNTETEKDIRTMLGFLGTIAESHSNGLHHTVSTSKRINAERECGRVPTRCFGYMKPVNNDSSVMFVDEETSKIVYEIFVRYANRELTSSIVKDLNARGLKTSTGGRFNIQGIRRIIRNSIYKGVLVMGRTSKTDVRAERKAVDPSEYIVRYREDLRIVPDELWELANKVLDDNGKNANNQFGDNEGRVHNSLFKGMITCGECGKHFKRYISNKSRRNDEDFVPKYNYKCSYVYNKHHFGSDIECDNNIILRREELLDCLCDYMEQMVEQVSDLEDLVKEIYKKKMKEIRKTKPDEIVEEIKEIEKQYKIELQLVRDGLVDDTQKLKELKMQLDNLKRKQSMMSVDINSADEYAQQFINNLKEKIETALNSEDEEFGLRINQMFKEIIAYKNGTLKVVLRNPLDDINNPGCKPKYSDKSALSDTNNRRCGCFF